jgi:ATP adenylyltransferase
MSARPLYNLDAARGGKQLERMRGLEADGICIFCLEHAHDEQRAAIEHIGKHWYVTRNDFPYEGTDAHYLIIATTHVVSFEELPDEAGAELWQIRRGLSQQLGADALATVERSGDMHLNGGSVAHLHVHLVALGAQPSSTVRFRVSARAAGDQS